MGDLCYKDKEKFPNGPWCKEGQFIMYGRYVGNRFQTKFGEQSLRIACGLCDYEHCNRIHDFFIESFRQRSLMLCHFA